MYIPEDVISKILSFSQIHPNAALIKDCLQESFSVHNVCLELDTFYLRHLLNLKCEKSLIKCRKILRSYDSYFAQLRGREPLIYTVEENETYEKYKIDTKKDCFCYRSYLHDLIHSFKHADMTVNTEYFHSMNNGHSYNYNLFSNKYQTEIFNTHKVLKKRREDFPAQYIDRVNDLRNHTTWPESMILTEIDEFNFNDRICVA